LNVRLGVLGMTIRVIEITHATLESIMRRVPRKGVKAIYALSTLSRLNWVVGQCKSLVLRAQCLASARGLCVETRESKTCDTKCASIMVIERQGELVVYKRTRNPIVVKLSHEGITISRRDSTIIVGGARITLKLLGKEGVVEKVLRLDEIEELLENSHLVKHSLKGLEIQLLNILRNLANCAKLTATQCP